VYLKAMSIPSVLMVTFLTLFTTGAMACGDGSCEPEPPKPEPKPVVVNEDSDNDWWPPVANNPCTALFAQERTIAASADESELARLHNKYSKIHKWVLVWVKNSQVVGVVYDHKDRPEGAKIWKMTAPPKNGEVCVKPHDWPNN
jgi:hypothetical protein